MIRGSPRRPERRTASTSAEASRVAATTSVVSNAGLTPPRALVAAAVTSPESRRGAFASPDAASSAIDVAVLAATGAADGSASRVIEAVCAVAVRPSGVALSCCAGAGASESAAGGRAATRFGRRSCRRRGGRSRRPSLRARRRNIRLGDGRRLGHLDGRSGRGSRGWPDHRLLRRRIDRGRGHFGHGRLRQGLRRHASRKKRERIDVALLVTRQADPEVDERVGEVGRPARPDGPDDGTLVDGAPRVTLIAPRCRSVAVWPDAVSIDTVLPPVGTLPAKLTMPPAGART